MVTELEMMRKWIPEEPKTVKKKKKTIKGQLK